MRPPARPSSSAPPSFRSRRASSSACCDGWSSSMKPEEIRSQTADQLDEQLAKLKKEQFNLRFQRASGQLENTSRVREVRRDIARVKTVQAQKRSGQAQRS